MKRCVAMWSSGCAFFGALWNAWILELTAGFAALGRQLGLSRTLPYRLVLTDSTLTLMNLKGEVLRQASFASPAQRLEVARALNPQGEAVVLRLPPSMVLWHTLQLSLSTGRRWRRAIELQFASWFPMPEAVCLWDASARKTEEDLEIRMALAHRGPIETLLESLRGVDVDVGQVDVEASDGLLLNLTPRGAAATARRWRRINHALAASVILVFLAIPTLSVYRQMQERADLTGLLKESRRSAQPSLQAREALNGGLADLAPALAARRRASAANLLAQLSEGLPNTAWVSALDYKEGDVQISVSSPKTIDLSQKLASALGVASIAASETAPEASDDERLVSSVSFHLASTP
jgi:hypothetical protein